MSDEHQKHLRIQIKHVSVNNWNYTENLPVVLHYTYFKPLIMKYILKRWQDSWDQQIHNLLHELHSIDGKTPCSYGQNPKEQVIDV
jgi:hypothetical protein